MKVAFKLSLICVFMATSVISAQEEKTETSTTTWFDMENCEICKPFAQHMDVLQQVQWETHLIDDGFISVAQIPEKLKPKMAELKKDMKSTIARAQSGENVKCCSYCTSLGGLIAAGAKQQELSTAGGEIMLMTADDPEMVAKLHTHAKKTIAAHKAMMQQMEEEDHLSDDSEEVKAGGKR